MFEIFTQGSDFDPQPIPPPDTACFIGEESTAQLMDSRVFPRDKKAKTMNKPEDEAKYESKYTT